VTKLISMRAEATASDAALRLPGRDADRRQPVGHGVIVLQTRTCAVRLRYVALRVASMIGSLD
jgi:hypothetical protein